MQWVSVTSLHVERLDLLATGLYRNRYTARIRLLDVVTVGQNPPEQLHATRPVGRLTIAIARMEPKLLHRDANLHVRTAVLRPQCGSLLDHCVLCICGGPSIRNHGSNSTGASHPRNRGNNTTGGSVTDRSRCGYTFHNLGTHNIGRPISRRIRGGSNCRGWRSWARNRGHSQGWSSLGRNRGLITGFSSHPMPGHHQCEHVDTDNATMGLGPAAN
jgi:hypothetical protein